MHEEARMDPLWNCNAMNKHFLKNGGSVAFPVVVSDLDEKKVWCKERTTARSCMKSKTVRFGIRYYLVEGLDVPYTHSMWDKNYGNCSDITPPYGIVQFSES